jgi:hypothetical protein
MTDPEHEWVKLRRGNDWGVVYISRSPLRNGTASARRRVEIHEGAGYRVRWPDGTVSVERAKLGEPVHTTVGDMGHECPITYQLPGIVTMLHGREHWVPLDEVEVLATDFPEPP